MKTYTEAITTSNDIEIFVEKNSIKDSSRLLIQLFSGTTNEAEIVRYDIEL